MVLGVVRTIPMVDMVVLALYMVVIQHRLSLWLARMVGGVVILKNFGAIAAESVNPFHLIIKLSYSIKP